ncbi:SDR family oxidoreductase [Nodosilinea nodulosa]|uniref:SDR family oxidoreductase n=1 Tax=Nodosilinea nodulosa TaxID=416001 RepID=UPI000308022A|nr:SDR family oxidoreductase [Nodosilinea nodulosa]
MTTTQTANQYDIRDPRNAYPQPPFPRQPQEAPGLAAKMDPQPDHGEKSYQGLGRMKGRKALITGGDSGIGRAVAIAYMREGASVAINYLEEEQQDVQSLLDLAEREGGTIIPMPGNLMDEDFCTSLVKNAAEQMGGLDALVINAGKQVMQQSIQDITTEQFDQTLKTNCYAMFWLSKAALQLMPPGSTIINVTSVVGFKPPTALLDYASTKFFIRGFTEALAPQALEKGIRVNGVAPGPFWTPLQPSGGQSQDNLEQFGTSVPMGRPGQPAEIASTFVFLATQESGFTTGEIIGVTGGAPIS